jgi:hypothetical protein
MLNLFQHLNRFRNKFGMIWCTNRCQFYYEPQFLSSELQDDLYLKIRQDLYLEQFWPVLSRNKQSLAGCIPGNPVENINLAMLVGGF